MKSKTYKLFLDVKKGDKTPEEAQIELLKICGVPDQKIYTGDKILKCDLGLYEVYWKDGHVSLASIGVTTDFEKWFAPTTWTGDNKDRNPTGLLRDYLDSIDSIVRFCK
jgi:hypothetical protein